MELSNTAENAKKTDNLKSGRGILKTQSGDENIPDLDKGQELIEREKIYNSPFELIGNQEIGYWIALGAFRISEKGTKSEKLREVENKDWDLIINVLCAIMAGKDMEEAQKALTKQA
jgi:hypothetical protein